MSLIYKRRTQWYISNMLLLKDWSKAKIASYNKAQSNYKYVKIAYKD